MITENVLLAIGYILVLQINMHHQQIRSLMLVKIVTACRNASGEPDFYFCIVECSSEDYEDGVCYDTAEDEALGEGYEGPFVSFDEFDGPNFLFEHFVWESATMTQALRS